MKETTTLRGLARIIDVGAASISRGIESGRLDKSVKVEGEKRTFEIFKACVEWYMNRDLAQDQDQDLDGEEAEEILSRTESRQLKDHFAAYNEKLDFQKKAGQYISVDKAKREVFAVSRIAKSRIELKKPSRMKP